MADQGQSNQSDGAGAPGGSRGRTITIVVLSIVVAVLIAALIWAVVIAQAATPKPSTSTPASATTTSSTPSATPTTPTTSAAVTTCAVGDLHVTLGTASGAAGSSIVPIIFTNTGSRPCELHGFPGVSFVGDGNGTQLGAAADEDESVAITQHTLQPGDAVQSLLKIAHAQNFAGCTTEAADGLRIYPPHSYDAVFVQASGLTACTNANIHLLMVQPVTAK